MPPMRLVNPLVRPPGVPAPPDSDDSAASSPPPGSAERLAVMVGCVAVFVVAVVLRLWTPSALWLDEALAVNIAAAPLHQIPSLLRHDGAPPLYYYLLHFWMAVFGQSDLAVRALSGVAGLATIPVSWLAGYRVGARWWRPDDDVSLPSLVERRRTGRLVGWTLALLVASSPFAVYYATEARMYALVMLFSVLGLLAVMDVLRRPSLWNALAVAATTSALVYSHYWSLYLVAVVGAGSLWCAWRGPYRRESRFVLGGVALGAITFLPWVPTFLYQVHHTGTPWAVAADFTALVYTFTELAGGNSDAGRGLALVFGFLALLAIAGSALDPRRVVIDLRTRPGVRLLAAASLATLVLAVVASRLAGSTFASRYTAVIAVLVMCVVAYGVTTLADRRVREGVIAVAVAFGLAASIPNAFVERTQAAQVAHAILGGRAGPATSSPTAPTSSAPA